MATHADRAIDPVPPSVREKAQDENYQRDFNVLLAIFRTHLEVANKHLAPNVRFAGQLRHLAHLMLDGWGGSDFPQQVFDDHGPQAILRALAKAYEQPAHVLGELEGD